MELFRVKERVFRKLKIKGGSLERELFIHEFFDLYNIYWYYMQGVMLGLGYGLALVKDIIFFWERMFSLKSWCWSRVSWQVVSGWKSGEEKGRLTEKFQNNMRSRMPLPSSFLSTGNLAESQEGRLVVEGRLENCQVKLWAETLLAFQIAEELCSGYSTPLRLHNRVEERKSRATSTLKTWEKLRINQNSFAILFL